MLIGMRSRMSAKPSNNTTSVVASQSKIQPHVTFNFHTTGRTFGSRTATPITQRSTILTHSALGNKRSYATENSKEGNGKPTDSSANHNGTGSAQDKQQKDQKDQKEQPAAAAAAAAASGPEAELAALRAELEEVTSQLKYAVADRVNAQRLAKQDVDGARQYGIQKFAVDLLEVADTLDMALQCVTPAERAAASRVMQEFATGVDMTARIMQKKLEAHGISAVRPLHQKFDPMQHQALFQLPGAQAGMVGAVVKPGYILNGRVIRPAQVGVTTAPPPPQPPAHAPAPAPAADKH